MFNIIVLFFKNIKLKKKYYTKIVIKYVLFIIINCYIYANHIREFHRFYLRKEKIFFRTLLINLIVTSIKNIVYIYMYQFIFLINLKIIFTIHDRQIRKHVLMFQY